MIKVVSLDFWGTLARHNPEYSAARASFLGSVLGLSQEEAKERYRMVKHGFDHRAETLGEGSTPLAAVETLLASVPSARPMGAQAVLNEFYALAQRHPPRLAPGIAESLRRLKEARVTVGIASNTNFLGGAFVQSLFGLDWDFAAYSDEVGFSKPHEEFFAAVFSLAQKAAQAAGRPAPRPEEVLHIGDHVICDVAGAQKAGFNALLTQNPDHTVQLLESLL